MKHNINIVRFFASLLVCCFVMSGAGDWSASAQSRKSKAKTDNNVNVAVRIVDVDGNPVSHAEVVVAEGAIRENTDSDGNVRFTADSRDRLTISAAGYQSIHAAVSALADSEEITLYKQELYSEMLNLPYMQISQRHSLGTTIIIKGEDLEKYSSTDIRNALTAIAPGVVVTEKNGAPGVSVKGDTRVSVTSRGRTLMYLVDDIPVDIDETPLDPQQIESITIVRDLMEKTLYGSTAAQGIVSIKTKRGVANNRYVNAFVEAGVNVADRMAEYVDAADYARLNNLARVNSGLTPLYSDSDIQEYEKNDAYSLTHPNVNFRDMTLKNVMSYRKAGFHSGGGNDIVKYYAYLGYAGEDDMYKIGSTADYNRVNINANLDVKVHRYITASFGLVSSMGIRRSPHYGYNTSYAVEFPTILNDVNTIPPLSFPIYAKNDPSLESPWYAITAKYTQNPIANLTENGHYTETMRKGLMNVKLNVDLSFLTKGLKSMSYAAYDSYNFVRLGTSEDYAAYIINNTTDPITGKVTSSLSLSPSHSVLQTSNKSKLMDYFSNRLYFVEKLSYDRTFGKHAVTAGLDYMITKRSLTGIREHKREMDFGFNASYVYDDRYIVSTTMNEHGTYALVKNRWCFSPTVGLGWIMSNESWLRDVSGVDFLKLRAQGGYLYYDGLHSANYEYDDYSNNDTGTAFGPYTLNQWFGSYKGETVYRTALSVLGNPNLRLQKRYEASLGVDGLFLGRRLSTSLTYFNFLNDGNFDKVSNIIPALTGLSSTSYYLNYAKTAYQGYEVSLGWKDNIGKDFSYSINGWASGMFSKIIRADVLPYSQPYRNRVGRSNTTIWGYRYLGQYQTDAEAAELTQSFDDELHAGDFKYQDMNGDGVLDSSDQCAIGDSNPAMYYGISLNLKYRDFDLLITGTGCSSYDLLLNNSYYWNGWGDANYTKYTLEHATDPSAPRLTYNQVNNNYVTSSYWLTDGSYFKIQTVELGYELPVRRLNITRGIRGMRVYVRGNNLLTLSGLKDLDPESISAGLTNYPLMKTFVGGFKFTF